MLTLSRGVTLVIRNAIQNSPGVSSDVGGLRLIQSGTVDGQPRLSMTPAPAPHTDDQIVEDRGARLFVEAKLGDELADKHLRLVNADDGRIRFRFEEQATLAS